MSTGLLLDVKIAIRQLRHAPATSLAAVLTLALGIGATTATVSLAAAVMAGARSIPDLDRSVGLWSRNRGEMETKRPVSPGDFLDWRRLATTVDRMVAVRERSFNVSVDALPMRVAGGEVTPGYFEFLGVGAAAGRVFTADDARQSAPRVVILSESFWRIELAARGDLLGRTLRLDGEPTTVVGILARSPLTGIFMPLKLEAAADDRAGRNLFVWARLRPGVDIEAAGDEMASIGDALERDHPQTNTGWTIHTSPLDEEFVGPQARLVLALLVGMAASVLLIGCVNVSNLLLARGVARQGEFAVRLALGAAPWHITRQQLVEAGLLTLVGSAGSLFASRWIVMLVISLMPLESPWLAGGSVNVRMLAVTAGAGFVAMLAAGLMPALAAGRRGLARDLQAAGRIGSYGRGRLTRGLVAVQVSVAVVLLIVAGLLNRSVIGVQQLAPGFDPENLLTARIELPAGATGEAAARWFGEALSRAGAIPGVAGAAASSRLPFAGSRFNPNRSLSIEGREPAAGEQSGAFALDYVVTPGYFATMKVPLRAGREFTPADGAGAPKVAVVSDTLARRYWPNRSPLGARLRQGDEEAGVWRTVVGVVGDIRNDDADQPPLPYLYLPLAQQPQHAMSLVVRTTGPPDALGDALRREIAAFDADQPVFEVRTMAAIVESDLRQTVVLIRLLNGLTAFAVGLAALGIWGVVSQLLAARRREIGVRVALGATTGQVVSLVARLAFVPVAIGLVVGLAAGVGVAQLLRSTLFEVTPTDPVTLAAACVILTLAALAAILDPVRRALCLDPVEALRAS